MKRNAIETIMGAVVLTVAAGFLAFAYDKGDVKSIEGYEIRADFSNATGIAPGSEVRIGGVKVGAVNRLSLDPVTYLASVHMQISENVKLPKDSSAAIVSSGLLGDKFIGIEPGADNTNLASGDRIEYTQSSVSIEELIGKFVFSGGGVDEGPSEEPAAKPIEGEVSSGAEGSAEPAKKENPFSLGLE